MNKVERLSLTREQVLSRLKGTTSFDQATAALFGSPTTMNCRERELFTLRYGVDIAAAVRENRERDRAERKRAELDRMFVCDMCGKQYRNGDHHCDNDSGRHFCSNSCARRYSASRNTEESRKRVSESLKGYFSAHKHTIACQECGKEFEANLQQKYGLCSDCLEAASQQKAHRIKELVLKKRYIHALSKRNVNGQKLCPACGAIRDQCDRPDICAHLNSFKTYSKFFGFDLTAIGSIRIYEEFDKIKNMLYDMYWTRSMSVPSLMHEFCNGINDSSYAKKSWNFVKLLKAFIELRNPADGQRLSYTCNFGKTSDKSFFKSGFHQTWNNKIFMYRSSYELDLCRELDSAEIDYMMECMTIDYFDTRENRMRYAVPDFYLPDFNMIIEVKSAFTLDKQNMMDKANSYVSNGYEFILEYEHKSYVVSEMKDIACYEKNIKCY